MKQLMKGTTKDKRILTLEDWNDHEVSYKYVVATTVEVPGVRLMARRVAFGFQTMESALKAYTGLVIGDYVPKDFKEKLTDRSYANYL